MFQEEVEDRSIYVLLPIMEGLMRSRAADRIEAKHASPAQLCSEIVVKGERLDSDDL